MKNFVRIEDIVWVIKGIFFGINVIVKIGLMEWIVKVSEIVLKWIFNVIGRYVGNYYKISKEKIKVYNFYVI